ncbi:MAG: RNA polymerase sigma factor [Polyangiaceae bacterium]
MRTEGEAARRLQGVTNVAGHTSARTSTNVAGHTSARTSTNVAGHTSARTSTNVAGHTSARTSTNVAGHTSARTSTNVAGHTSARTSTNAHLYVNWGVKSSSEGEPGVDVRTHFAQIYRTNAAYVSRLLARLGVPVHDIEDSVQDVFLAYLRCEFSPAAPSAIRALLYGIAQRIRWSRLRWLQRHEPPRHRALDVPDPSALMDPHQAHPEARLLLNEAARLLTRAAARLPPKQREVLELGSFERLTAAQIAKLLGTSPNTVSSRLRTARLELAREVARMRFEPGMFWRRDFERSLSR